MVVVVIVVAVLACVKVVDCVLSGLVVVAL